MQLFFYFSEIIFFATKRNFQIIFTEQQICSFPQSICNNCRLFFQCLIYLAKETVKVDTGNLLLHLKALKYMTATTENSNKVRIVQNIVFLPDLG